MVAVSPSFSSDDNRKRQMIRRYFARPGTKWPLALLILGLVVLSIDSLASTPAQVGQALPEFQKGQIRTLAILIALIGGAWLAVQIGRALGRASDATIDSWFHEDMNRLQRRALERLNLDQSQLMSEQLVIVGPILWEVHGVPKREICWRKGRDRLVRFSINAITILHLLEHKISSYQCDYNFIRGAPLNERDDEYYYRDIVAVSTREDSTNYTLPNNQIMKVAQSFTVSVASGERINVIINSFDIEKLTGGRTADAGADRAIKALRKTLSEKKIG